MMERAPGQTAPGGRHISRAGRTGHKITVADLGVRVRPGALRDELHRICLRQALARDAAFVTVAAAGLGRLDDREYREAQLAAGLAEGRLIGHQCPACGKVYIPSRGTCPADGVPTDSEVELPATGTVTTFSVVNVGYPGQQVTPPYVAAAVLLDGADIAFQHLILGCDPGAVRMGMRVRAVWRPRAEWSTTAKNISHFAPAGGPDAPYESYARFL